MRFYYLSFYPSLIQTLFVLFIAVLPALSFAGLELQKNKHYIFQVESLGEKKPCGNTLGSISCMYVDGQLMKSNGETQPLSLRLFMRKMPKSLSVYRVEAELEIFTEEDINCLSGFVEASGSEERLEDRIPQMSYLWLDKSRQTEQKRLVTWSMSEKKEIDERYDPEKYCPQCDCEESTFVTDPKFYMSKLSVEFLSALASVVLNAKEQGEFTGTHNNTQRQRRSVRLKIANDYGEFKSTFGEGNSLILLP